MALLDNDFVFLVKAVYMGREIYAGVQSPRSSCGCGRAAVHRARDGVWRGVVVVSVLHHSAYCQGCSPGDEPLDESETEATDLASTTSELHSQRRQLWDELWFVGRAATRRLHRIVCHWQRSLASQVSRTKSGQEHWRGPNCARGCFSFVQVSCARTWAGDS